MNNRLCPLLTLAAICLCFLSHSAANAAEQTPETLVRDFYAWYTQISEARDESPVRDDTIYNYVSACTVAKCRIEMDKNLIGSDPFVQTNGFMPKEDRFLVCKAIPLGLDTWIVPVRRALLENGVVSAKPDWPYLIVFVRKEHGALRIIKVTDSDPEFYKPPEPNKPAVQ